MTVYELDQNNFYIGFAELTEENKDTLNYTAVQMTRGYVRSKFDKELQEWVEGATEEEIKEWEEANKPLPQEPSEMEILSSEVEKLKAENKLLNAQVEALSATTDFQEDCLAEMAMLVYA